MVGITAVLALVINLLAVVHYGTRLRRELVEQIKAEEKRWAEHETRLALLERGVAHSQDAMNSSLSSLSGRLEQISESLLRIIAAITKLE